DEVGERKGHADQRHPARGGDQADRARGGRRRDGGVAHGFLAVGWGAACHSKQESSPDRIFGFISASTCCSIFRYLADSPWQCRQVSRLNGRLILISAGTPVKYSWVTCERPLSLA